MKYRAKCRPLMIETNVAGDTGGNGMNHVFLVFFPFRDVSHRR